MARESVAHEVGLALLVALLAGGAIVGAVVAAGGLPEPAVVDKILGQDPGENLTSKITAVMRPDSILDVRHEVTFPSDRGGIVALERPCPDGRPQPYACLLNPTIGGRAAEFTERAARTEITVDGMRAVITYELSGAVSGYTDIGALDWTLFARPLGSSPGGFKVEGTLEFPSAAAPVDARLHGTGPDRTVTTEGATVHFAGSADRQIFDPALDVAFPIALIPDLPDLRRSNAEGRTIFETTESFKDVADTATGTATGALEAPKKILRYVVLAFGFGIPALLWMAVAVTVVRRARYRMQHRVEDAGPAYEEEPPSQHDPALVSLLHGAGRPERAAVAGSILHLAARGEIDLQDLAGDAFTLAVKPDALGTSAGDSLLVATLRAFAADEGGRISGPPLFKRPVGLWDTFRRDIQNRAESEGLVRRVVSLGLISSAAVLTAVGFGLVYGPVSPAIFFPASIILPMLALAVTLRLPQTLSDKGRQLRGRWEAYGRHLKDQTALNDSPPAGVAIWGDQLAYGAVLGVAPTAAGMLSPPE